MLNSLLLLQSSNFDKVVPFFFTKNFLIQKTSLRALDIGCAVGRASFELASKCQEVIGIDFSHNFVKACNQLKKDGKMDYKVLVEGDLRSDHTAVVSSNLVSCAFLK